MRKKDFTKAVKGMSLALAVTMGVSLAQTGLVTDVKAATKNGVVVSGKTSVLSKKKGASIYIGGKKLDLDLLVSGTNIKSKVKWTSADKNIVTVNKNGKLTAKSNGTAVITATYGKKKYNALVKVYTRADSVSIMDEANTDVTEISMLPGETKNFKVSYKLSPKAVSAGAVSSTYNSYVSTEDAGVATVVKDNGASDTFSVAAVKEGETYVELNANQTSELKVKTAKYGVTARLKVVVSTKFSGKQTGAKKITVTGRNLTAKTTDYSVKGPGTPTVASVELNSSATEAVLTMNTDLRDGNYTVENGTNSSVFNCVAAKPSKIDIPNKNLVLTGDYPSATGTIEYKVLNQFGEDVTKTAGNLTATLSAGSAAVSPNTGLINVTGIPSNLPLNSSVSVTLVKADAMNPLSGTFSVVLSPKAKAASVSVKGVYNIATKKPYSLAVNSSDNSNARLLVEVKDQYGRKLNSTDGVNVVANGGLTGLGINSSTVYNNIVDIDGVSYIAIPFTGVSTVKAGSVTVTLLALYGTTGNNTATTTITIAGTKQVSSFSVTAPAEVYAGESTYFDYKAANSAGAAITDYATLSDTNFGVKLPAAFSWENSANGTAKLKYDATKDTVVSGITWSNTLTSVPSNGLFTVAATMQPVMATFTVSAPTMPAALKSFTVEGVVEGDTTKNVLTKITVIDNKGRELTDLSRFSNYYLGVKLNGTTPSLTLSQTGGTVNAGFTFFKLSDIKKSALSLKFAAPATITSDYVSDNYTFSLHKDTTGTGIIAGSDRSVSVTGANIKKLSNYEVSIPSTIYSGRTTNPAHVSAVDVGNVGYNAVKVIVTGRAVNGDIVQLKDTDFQLDGTSVPALGIANNGNKTLEPSKVAYKATKDGNLTETLRITVNDGSGNFVNKTVTISSVAPVVKSVTAKTDELALANFNAAGILNTLLISDNYTAENNGVNPSTEADKKAVTGIRLVSSSSNAIKANWNNTPNVTFTGGATGDKVTLQITFTGGASGTFNYTLR